MLKIKPKKREYIGKAIEKIDIEIPNLLEIQLKSYDDFLQKNINPKERDPEKGLEYVLRTSFPIESNNGKIILDYLYYEVEEPENTEDECIKKGITYEYSIWGVFRTTNLETKEVREKRMFLCKIPAITNRGSFIFNGVERTIINQIYRTPGVIFSYNDIYNLFVAKIIPAKGSWLEIELDEKKEVVYVRIDRKKRILLSTFLKSIYFDEYKGKINIENDSDIIDLFYETISLKLNSQTQIKEIFGENEKNEVVLAEDIISDEEIRFEAGYILSITDIEKLIDRGIKEIKVINPASLEKNKVIINTIRKDDIEDLSDAIEKVFSVIRPGNPIPSSEKAKKEISSMFFDEKKYDLGEVGRYKLNLRLYNKEEKYQERILKIEDIIETIKRLIKIYNQEIQLDDIDHLGNRRIRSVGELLANHIKLGFSRMERTVKERMTTAEDEALSPHRLISIKYITGAIKEFFGTNPLSQFLEQTNPLAEITHKRRISALGKGGLTKERAGFEARDVHYTHYGRLCPIETPEGQNIGLILSLGIYTKLNSFGFLITPYKKVENGYITDKIEYISPIEEDNYYIAQFDTNKDNKRKITDELVVCRHQGNITLVEPEKVNYIDLTPKQIFSISTALIPFLEHDDANRALMGSNMQRQAIPLINPDAPIVGTGLEEIAAKHSNVCISAENDGVVIKVDNQRIVVEEDGGIKREYKLVKMRKTNQNTVYNQRPIVRVGEKVKKGQLLTDGPAVQDNELALGKNVLVAFMPWEGYNFEDAIVISEKLVKDDVFTSITLKEFVTEARDTKQGPEIITRDIPHISENALKYLDESGIIIPGTYVKPGDILVGKITPKAYKEQIPEYKLLYSIFGEKARDVKDTSLRVPSGFEGIVVDVIKYDRSNYPDLPTGVEKLVKVYIAQKRKIKVGDKLAGRHGNKGVISTVLPVEDMPFLEDGTPVDIVLNPLGVPSRMNIGQILEVLLGWAGYKLGKKFATPVFEGAKVDDIKKLLKEAGLPEDGKTYLYDGKTGERFTDKVTVGYMYILKLNHMVDDKMHARSTGPYSLITQQPLGGKSQFGGQRVGEMEVWAFETYGAAYTLQEILTVKSDDIDGRARMYENIVEGKLSLEPDIPESFNVIVQELRGLAIDLQIHSESGKIPFKEKEINPNIAF